MKRKLLAIGIIGIIAIIALLIVIIVSNIGETPQKQETEPREILNLSDLTSDHLEEAEKDLEEIDFDNLP